MTKTKTLAALARVRAILSLIDWQEALSITAHGLRILWAAVQLVTAALVLAGTICWEHRREIRDNLVAIAAGWYVAALWTRHAGAWTRQQLERCSEALGRAYAAVVTAPARPIPGLAGLSPRQLRELLDRVRLAREALARLIARLYPVAVA